MINELFSKANNQLGDMMVPTRKLQGVFVKHMERVTDFQLHTLRHYSEIGLQQMRALQDVSDPQTFMTKNAEMLKSFNENMSSDMNEFVKLQRHFAEDLQEVGKEGAEKASQMTRSVTEQAAQGMQETTEKGAEAAEKASRSASESTGTDRSSGSSERAPAAEKSSSSSSSSDKSSSGSSGKRSA